MDLTLGIISRNTNGGEDIFSHGGICHAKGVSLDKVFAYLRGRASLAL